VLALAGAAASLAACGGATEGTAGDGGRTDGEANDGTTIVLPTDGGSPDGTTIFPTDGGPTPEDAASDSRVIGGDGGGHVGDDGGGGGYVDAGYYFGDGSFWVEGGAYDDAGIQLDASSPEVDASPGCASLAACCPSLEGSSQGLCDDIVAQGNATDCATELAQLESGGNCTGVSVLAAQIQVQPNLLVSDGTMLFWTTTGSPSLLAMPVMGGPITILLNDPITNPVYQDFTNPFLAVDNVNVYVLVNNGIVRIPKNGSTATLVNEPGSVVQAVTTLGNTAYWTEFDTSPPVWWTSILKSAPLQGMSVSEVATFVIQEPTWRNFAVTSSAVFGGSYFFPLSAVPASGMTNVTSLPAAARCGTLTSDTSAVYCNCTSSTTCSNVAIASDATTAALGTAISSSYIVFDDTYAYWADMTTVGTIMKAPKAGGGTATVLARDTSPTAIAVDANSVYWSDQEGYIKSVPK
jgi:hypothetical protein